MGRLTTSEPTAIWTSQRLWAAFHSITALLAGNSFMDGLLTTIIRLLIAGDTAQGEVLDGPAHGHGFLIDAARGGAIFIEHLRERILRPAAPGSAFGANAVEIEDAGIADGVLRSEEEARAHAQGLAE